MKIVELYGLSGAGKSTAAKEAKKLLTARGYSVLMMNEIYYRFYNNKKSLLRAIFNAPVFALCCLCFICSYGATKSNLKCFARIVIMKYIAKVQKKPFDFLLIDEGIIQFSPVTGGRRLKSNFITRCYLRQLQKLSASYNYIHAAVSVQTALKRLQQRHYQIEINRLCPEKQQQILETTLLNFQLLLAGCRGKCFSVNMEVGPKECGRALAEIMLKLGR